MFFKGDQIEITCGERVVAGTIMVASPNSVSLMIKFEAILGGHVGMMPVFLHDDGIYRSIIDGTEVSIRKKVLTS